MKHITDFAFLQRNIKDWLLIILLIAAFLCLLGAFLLLKVRQRDLSVEMYIKIKNLVISILLSALICNLFYLHIAIPIWLLLYFILGIVGKRHRYVQSLLKTRKKSTSLSAKQFQVNHEIKSPLHFTGFNCFRILKQLRMQETQIVNKMTVRGWQIPKFVFFPFYTYATGIIVFAITDWIFDGQYYNTNCVGLILLENYVLMLAMLFIVYRPAHRLTVDNECHRLFGSEIFFRIYFILFAVALFIIVTCISFNGAG